jgi:dihydroorotate dehydrogenase electron transfer subunit
MNSLGCTIIAKRECAPSVFELTLKAELSDINYVAGQFVHIEVPLKNHILKRPITVAKWNKEENTFTVVIRAIGEGTQAITSLAVHQNLNVLMTLGHGFNLDELKQGSHLALIGGGLGIPALLEAAKAASLKGVEVTSFLGFGTKSQIFYEEEFRQYGKCIISTDDGSVGIKGHVGMALDSVNQSYDQVYACGPLALSKMVQKRYPESYLSLEERMACGIGACAGCVVFSSDLKNNFRVCKDGPIFKAKEVSL